MSLDGKIKTLNFAIREAIPHMRRVANANPNARILVRAVKFSDGAQWHISQPTPVEVFEWGDLTAEGETDMGKALSVVADELRMPPMDQRGLPPVLVLVSDGMPTDDFAGWLKALLAEPWGRKAVRISIAIGRDADIKVLERFMGHPELKPLRANNPESLVDMIRWTSTVALQASVSSTVQRPNASTQLANVPVPAAPNTVRASVGDVW